MELVDRPLQLPIQPSPKIAEPRLEPRAPTQMPSIRMKLGPVKTKTGQLLPPPVKRPMQTSTLIRMRRKMIKPGWNDLIAPPST